MAKSPLQKFIDDGIEWSQLTGKQLDDVARQLSKAADLRRRDAEAFVQSVVDRSREASARVTDTLGRQLSRQLDWLSERFDELEDRVEDLADQVARSTGARNPDDDDEHESTDPAPAKKAPAKKAPAKKAPATKAPVKKTAAKKAPAKKAPAKKAPAKQAAATRSPAPPAPEPGDAPAVGESGVRAFPASREQRDL
jgi:polyhydroxyalkanoate synthesis regulator phasin